MADSEGESRGVLYRRGSLRRLNRKAALEQHLRDAAAHDEAIREVALPAIDELKRVREARRQTPLNPSAVWAPVPLARTVVPPSESLRTLGSMLGVKETPIESTAQDEVPRFNPSHDYTVIEVHGTKLHLTELAANIVRELHEEYQKTGMGLSFRALRKRTGCKKVWDAFRRRDGREFWTRMIDKPEKDHLRLKLD